MYSRLFSAMKLILILSFTLAAQDSLQVTEIGRLDYWDNISEMIVEGDYLYIAGNDAGLHIMDISDPQNPTMAAHLLPDGFAKHIILKDTICYVLDAGYYSDDYHGFKLFDISDPAAPEILSSFEISGTLDGMALIDTVLYISQWQNIFIYNVADPLNPYYVAEYTHWGFSLGDLYSYGSALYAAEWGIADNVWYNIFDASDPYNLVLAGDFPNSWNCYLMHFSGQLGVLPVENQGFRIFDMHNPLTPVLLSETDTPGDCLDGYFLNDALYIADGESGGLRIYDVSDPAEPVFTGSSLHPNRARTIAAAEDAIYVGDFYTGLEVFDGSDLQNPAYLSTAGEFAYFYDIVTDSNLAYCADSYFGMRIFDISDAQNPVEIGSWDSGVFMNGARCIAKEGDIVYAGRLDYGLTILDVSDPASPVEIGSCGGFSISWDIALGNGYVYGSTSGGINFIDVGDPFNPQYSFMYDPLGYSNYDVQFHEDHLYIAIANGLMVLDVTNPASPVEVVNFDEIYFSKLDIQDNLLANIYSGELTLLNISNPAEPQVLGSVDFNEAAGSVKICGDHAAISLGNKGFCIADISDPQQPFIAGFYDTPGYAWELDVIGNEIFVADKWNFGIYEFGPYSAMTENNIESPADFTLHPVYPNPFNGQLAVNFTLERAGDVRLAIYDVLGREVQSLVNGHLSFGEHNLLWNSDGVPSGVYLVRLTEDGGQLTAVRKAVLVK